MANSNLPVPQRTQSVAPIKGAKLPKQPITIINNPPRIQSARRNVARRGGMIEIGGGPVPKLKCSRKDLGVACFAVSVIIGAFFTAKYGLKNLFSPKEKTEGEKEPAPDPPKIQALVDCVNNAGEPKKVLIPNMLVEGGLSILGGREGCCKTVLGHQVAIELARGYGELVEESITPQIVIIFDGEMDDDDYAERFGKMDIPSNIQRISECNFSNLKQLATYIMGIVSGLLSPATIIIDNLVALSLEPLTGKAVNAFFRDLKKIQRDSSQTITFVIVDHIGKAPEGQSLDNSLLAGSANLARFAHNIMILDKSARGADYRYAKFTKQRKAALPDEVLEMVISEEEYLHLEPIGYTQEADILNNKTNRKRFGQEVEDEEDAKEEPKEDGRGRRWTDEDTARLVELALTLETPDKDHIASMMNRTPDMIYKMARQNGIKLMSKPRGRKPKQKPDLDEQ